MYNKILILARFSSLINNNENDFLFDKNDDFGSWHILNKKTKMFAVYSPLKSFGFRCIPELNKNLTNEEAINIIIKHYGLNNDT